MTYAPHACIAHPCTADRAPGSGFCEKHKREHEKLVGGRR